MPSQRLLAFQLLPSPGGRQPGVGTTCAQLAAAVLSLETNGDDCILHSAQS
jgi:hypothetical protein